MLLIAVPGGPPLQLALGTAAELQRLLPVLFKEVEDPGSGGILLPLRLTEGPAAHVDVQAAGGGAVAQIAQSGRLFTQHFPRKAVKMF